MSVDQQPSTELRVHQPVPRDLSVLSASLYVDTCSMQERLSLQHCREEEVFNAEAN